MNVKPFIKWAGGKGQLLKDIRKKYPISLGVNIKKYCEPFVGGGAVLFDILSNFDVEEVLINDINAELSNTYTQIKVNLESLIKVLEDMQAHYWSLDNQQRKIYYYDKRERFNYLKVNGNESVNIEKAALFIFLNKTCFNGLFRVNKKGMFNVPMGAYKKPLICDKENLRMINRLLQNTTITCGDYSNCSSFIDENTFVYIDPPYRPLTESSSFTSYAETEFNDKQQIELGKFVDSLHKSGASVVISNSDPKNEDKEDDFFEKIYASYNIERVSAKRMINCNSAKRGNINELLITNF